VQEEQFARFSPPELIKLAFFCALLEQTPHNSDKELVSRRYKLVKIFSEEIIQVAPIESLYSALAYSEDEEIADVCEKLVDALVDSNIPVSLSMWRSAFLYHLQCLEASRDLYDLFELMRVTLVQFGNGLNVKTAGILLSKMLLICTVIYKFDDDVELINEVMRNPSKIANIFVSYIESDFYLKVPSAGFGFPSAEISSVSLHYLFSKYSEYAPLKLLEEGRRELTQSQTNALSSCQLNAVTAIIVAFMQEHVRVPLGDSVVSLWKISKLHVQLLPSFIKYCVQLIKEGEEMSDEKIIKPVINDVQQKLYEKSTLVVDSYVSRLQLLTAGVGNAFCLSEPCKEYFLEAQLMRDCQQLTITRATPTETIVSNWDKLFKQTILFSVAKSFRPLIARWIRWSLMIHNLRHELAKFTAVGVVGLVNSGKSQLVNKLFQIKVCFCCWVFSPNKQWTLSQSPFQIDSSYTVYIIILKLKGGQWKPFDPESNTSLSHN